ncbi:3-hydroxyacyl-CoA dehydrogenase NAD-binding domain-containing protein [uncultured Aquimonas sp.]|uniref:3-hydroxyacyl-CoA dehydrogenase NAD-binding domain-containing protein n=1 Tax=uncultured Aquimonas sp. TaxID=385483 RepID=UPI000869CCD4|nr:3-hydroxyacyl-CoA dehydrogenase NAD-binding domain-containing protein [uncultured Aquimonas sp.]ODU48094.1 MAG: 3-hydroxyacyl-CoA dehydrogenase [Xanthomonadaceae bacterium SCN 69-123]
MFDGLRFKHWRPELRDDRVVVLTFDRADSSVNTLAREVLEELEQLVERIAIEKPKGVVVISGKTSGFVAGADIAEFKTYHERGTVFESIRYGQNVFQKLAELPCPTVAAIHGFCMGGGTELSLACRYRVASTDDSTRIGLPEVKLGIYPGWGGSVRLPPLVGAPAAFDMMLTGRALSASNARAIGLIDKTCEPAVLLDTALALLKRGVKRPLKQRLTGWATNWWPVRQALAPMLVKQVSRKARKAHYPAPFALIETWRRSGGPVESRLVSEAKSVAKLAGTPTAQNLVRVYFLQERLKGLGGKSHDIKHVHVVGAGVMGGDIAAWSALRGFETTLQDRSLEQIQPAIARAHTFYEKKLKREDKRAAAIARLNADVDGAGVAKADLVIEAIFENLDAKRALYAKVEENLPANSLLTSNTSSIPLTDLRAELKRPAQFAGLHFFNPVSMMPLVEIVRHEGMDAETERRLAAFCRAIDKLPVPVAGTPGFLVNRILMPYLLEAMTLYSEGVPGPVIDKAALAFGMPMGPIELADTVGLDVAASVGKIMAEFLNLPIPSGLDGLLASGKRGRKDGQGFYTWENGRAKKPEVPKDYKAPEDLTDRLVLAFVNEAVACLHEGVVADADLLDAGVIFGTGFAPFRGGPIQYVRSEGAAKLKARLEQLAGRHGPRFNPRPGWDALIPG